MPCRLLWHSVLLPLSGSAHGIRSSAEVPVRRNIWRPAFEDETLLFEETLRHSTEEIAQYASIVDQKDFRKDIIVNLLKEKEFEH